MRSRLTADAFERELAACRDWRMRQQIEKRQAEYDQDYRATLNALGTLTFDMQKRAARSLWALGGPSAPSGSEGWSAAVDRLRLLGVPGWRLYDWDRRMIAVLYLNRLERAAA